MGIFRRGGGDGAEQTPKAPAPAPLQPLEPQEPPRLARGMWKRFLLCGALVVLMTAAATATAGLLEVKDVANAFKQRPRLRIDTLTRAEVGGPQTILLLGSDLRKADRIAKRPGRSDTMMLIRLDPDKKKIAVLSVPRDLKVHIKLPDGRSATDKINAAYTYGGPKQVVKTIKEEIGIDINHVFDVDFKGFRALVNFIGCVYVDVDRRYFNDNSGYPKYATIDIKPGYQKLCGQDALDYVRFRHEDSDLVRAARQQEFLAQAKAQSGVKSLFGDRKQLARLVGRYTRTDIKGTSAVLTLLKLGIFSAGKEVREVHFRTGSSFENQISYLVASKQQIHKTVTEFLAAEGSAGPRGTLKSTNAEREAARRRKRKKDAGVAGLEAAKKAGEDQVVPVAAKVPFPIYFPRLRTSLAVYSDIPRVYTIKDDHGRPHTAYRMVLKKGLVGEYYGVQGMNWSKPPILDAPHDKRRLGRRDFDVYYDGDRIARVAWHTPSAVYWVSNTLLRSLGNKQMLAIAKSLQRIGR